MAGTKGCQDGPFSERHGPLQRPRAKVMVASSGKPSQHGPEQCPMLTPVVPNNKVSLRILFLCTSPRLHERHGTLLWRGCGCRSGALGAQGAPGIKAHGMEAWYCVQVNTKPLRGRPVQPGHSTEGPGSTP